MTGNSVIISSHKFDFSNYKVLSIIEPFDKNLDFNSTVNYIEVSEQGLIRNYPAYYHVYSLGGYNLSFTDAQKRTANELLKNGNDRGGEYAYANAANADEFVLTDGAVEQLFNNGVKYIITNSPLTVEQFESCSKLNIEDLINIGDSYWGIVLGNIPSIVHTENRVIPFKIEGNKLMIDNFCQTDKVTIAFPYNDKYACYQYINGKKIKCSIDKNGNGFMTVFPYESASKIELSYQDILSNMAIIFSIGGVIAFCFSIVLQCVSLSKRS